MKNNIRLLIGALVISNSFVGSYFLEPVEVYANESNEIEVEFNGFKVLFDTSKGEIVRYVSGTGALVIPEEINGVQVKSIGYRAFRPDRDHFNNNTPQDVKANMESITSVYIPEGVTYIGEGAFCFSYNLESIYLPSTLSQVGETVSAFYMCTKLKDVYYGGTEEQWENINVINVYFEDNPQAGSSAYNNYFTGDSYNKFLYTSNRYYNSDGSAVKNLASTLPFDDVNRGELYFSQLEYLYNNSIINGTSDTAFSPNDTMTRAVLVVMLHRMEGEPEAEYAGFTDVKEDDWYSKSIDWAKENEIVNGTTDGSTFSPNDPLTKEQVVAIIDRYYNYKEYELEVVNTGLGTITDIDNVSSWFEDNVREMYKIGILNTDFGNNFSPTSKATRADVAYMLGEFLLKVNK